MPGFDGTGPQGRGSMTGGGFGYCTGYMQEGDPIRPASRRFFNREFRGRGIPGMGGRGRGRMNLYYATGLPGWQRYAPTQPQTQESALQTQQPTGEQEIQYLKQEATAIEQQLTQIRSRIKELRGD